MSESSVSVDQDDILAGGEWSVKEDISRRVSKTRPSDVLALVDAFGLPRNLNPRVPPAGMTMD